MGESASIIVCGQRFDVGRRVVTFEDDPALSGYTPHCVGHNSPLPTHPVPGLGATPMRYRARRALGGDRSIARLGQIVRQVVIHHDGMASSRDCFRVLHDERGLSVHFLIDNNGDVLQTLDPVDCALHAAGVNDRSIGIELCNRGDAVRFPNFYPSEMRDRYTCTINGHQFLSYGFTREQFDAMVALGRALHRIFPRIPEVYPQDGAHEPVWSTLTTNLSTYAGYLGHYHVSARKWDPGPWDFKRFIAKLRARTFLPLTPSAGMAVEASDASTQMLYENNEQAEQGGYFPIGPLGELRLWHGGVHLTAERGAPLVAPFDGTVVAARLRAESAWSPIGSTNFVLIRHDLTISGQAIRFFTLFFHIEEGPTSGGDGVTLLRESVSGGQVVARVGEAGPPGNWRPQTHFSIFSEHELGALIEPGFWRTIDGSKGGRLCDVPQVVGAIDSNRDHRLARHEVRRFFQSNPKRKGFRRFAVRHLSEWSDGNDWQVVLNRSREFAQMTRAAKRRLFVDQIEPTLWWDDSLTGIGLPTEPIVWSYHPITFVRWLHNRMQEQVVAATGIQPASAYRGRGAPVEIHDDGTGLEGFTSDSELLDR